MGLIPRRDGPFVVGERVECVEVVRSGWAPVERVVRHRGTVDRLSLDWRRVFVLIDNSAVFEFDVGCVRRLDVVERLGELA